MNNLAFEVKHEAEWQISACVYGSGSQFQSSRPPALHISYVTLIASDVCSIRT